MLSIKIDNLAVDKYQPEIVKYSYPLLLIHGAGGTSRYLKNYLSSFAGDGWLSYAINLRGHYPSDFEPALAQVTIENYIDDVKKVVNVLGLQNCVLIGHSMGGLIAQKTAACFQSVKALVTVASATPLGVSLEAKNNPPYSGDIFKSMWDMLNFKQAMPSYNMMETAMLSNIDENELKDIYSMFVPESSVVGYQVAQGVSVDRDKIKCPKLVIGCLLDTIAPAPVEQKLAEFLQADFLLYEQFSHFPMLERGWEKSAADISKWLKDNVQ